MKQATSDIQSPVRHVEIVPARSWAALEFKEPGHFGDWLLPFMIRDVNPRFKMTALGVVLFAAGGLVFQPLEQNLADVV